MSNLDENKNIFNFIFSEAMKDATLMRAYEGEKTWLYECAETEWGKELKEFVGKVIRDGFKTQDDYDKEFMELAKKICKDIKEEPKFINDTKNPEFTFGNAQKLINMTMKYFYVMTYADSNKKYNFRFCHCPMDRIMLDKVWEHYKKTFPNHSKSGHYKIGGYTKTDFCESWGKEHSDSLPNRYGLFQKLIGEIRKKSQKSQSNLEYDYEEWGNKAEKTDE